MIEVTVNYRDLQSMTARPQGVPVEEHVSYDIIMGSLIRRKLLSAGMPIIGVLWAFTVYKGILTCHGTPEEIVYRWYENADEMRAKAGRQQQQPKAAEAEEDL